MKLSQYLLLIIGFCCLSPVFAKDIYPFSNPKTAERFQQLTSTLRCLVCQNQSLAESNAPLASDLRQKVYHKMTLFSENLPAVKYLQYTTCSILPAV